MTSIDLENAAQSAQNPPGCRYLVDCTWSDAPATELAPPLERIWAELPTEHSFSIWYGWAPARPLPDMAFSVEGHVYLATYVIYTDEADDERYGDWVHSRTRDLARAGCGMYLGTPTSSGGTTVSSRTRPTSGSRRCGPPGIRRDGSARTWAGRRGGSTGAPVS